MYILQLFSIFLFQFSMYSYDLQCRSCTKTDSRQSFLNHALNAHGSFTTICRFCPIAFNCSHRNALTANRKHLKTNHPLLLLGFLLYSCSLREGQIRNNIYKKWNNPAFAKKIYEEESIESKLFKTRIKCSHKECEEKTDEFSALSAIFHAAQYHLQTDAKEACCKKSFYLNKDKNGLAIDYFKAIDHTKKCHHLSLDRLMLKTFPILKVTWEEDNLAINFRDSMSSKVVKEIADDLINLPALNKDYEDFYINENSSNRGIDPFAALDLLPSLLDYHGEDFICPETTHDDFGKVYCSVCKEFVYDNKAISHQALHAKSHSLKRKRGGSNLNVKNWIQ